MAAVEVWVVVVEGEGVGGAKSRVGRWYLVKHFLPGADTASCERLGETVGRAEMQ